MNYSINNEYNEIINKKLILIMVSIVFWYDVVTILIKITWLLWINIIYRIFILNNEVMVINIVTTLCQKRLELIIKKLYKQKVLTLCQKSI